MIGVIDVSINAANPQMPLYPVRAFKNSPSSIRLRNVPKRIGNWNINSVQIVAAYPDSSIKTANCVLVGGVWVGTIEGCPISGRSENGFTVFASGIDENGNPVSNYVLGKGLIEILEGDGTITPDAHFYYVHLLDEEPDQPKEGDMWEGENGYVIWQDGEENPLGQIIEVDDELSPTSENPVQNKVVNSALEEKRGVLDYSVRGCPTVQNGGYFIVTRDDYKEVLTYNENEECWGDPNYWYIIQNGSVYQFQENSAPSFDVVLSESNQYSQTTTVSPAPDVYLTYTIVGFVDELAKASQIPQFNQAQTAAINSNITAAKVAQYDEALTKFNYEFHTATKPDPYIPSNMFPIEYSASGETFTINESEFSTAMSIEDVGFGTFRLVHHNPLFGVDVNLCYINRDGTFGGYIDVDDVTFNGTSPTQNVTQIAVISQGYDLIDRAVNTINISPEFSTYNLDLPPLVQGRARDFIIRAVAPAYYFSTPPTLSASGVTLMNAEGEMPEIATDENAAKTTLVYFSEIAPNVFLVKGEQLETIS